MGDFWYQTYVKSGLRPSTQHTYETNIYQHVIPQLGQIPLCQLTQKDLHQFYAHLKKEGRLIRTDLYGKGLSDRMVRMCHAMPGSPGPGGAGEPDPDQPGNRLQAAAQARTRDAGAVPPGTSAVSHAGQADGYFELFLLDLSTGLRRGELLALQWSDLDLDAGTLSVTQADL